jgi:hypothetical protein
VPVAGGVVPVAHAVALERLRPADSRRGPDPRDLPAAPATAGVADAGDRHRRTTGGKSAVVIALVCWTPAALAAGRWRSDSLSAKLGAALLCASLVIGMPVTGRSMLNENNSGQQLLLGVRSLFDPQRDPPEEQWYRRAGNDDRRVAGYLDNKRLPAGSVLMDTFISALVWLASDDPHQFVVTSDYDFSAALNRPWDFGVQYILVSNPAGNAAEDAITRRYPTIWVDGGGIGTLVYSVDAPTGRNGGGSTGSTRRRNTSAPHRRASPVCARAVRPGGLHRSSPAAGGNLLHRSFSSEYSPQGFVLRIRQFAKFQRER